MSCFACEGHTVTYCPVCGHGELPMKECPDCHGTGKTAYMAYDMRTNDSYEVEEIVWLTLPESFEEAMMKGKNVFRDDEGGDRCPTCGGEGEIIDEDAQAGA